MSKKTILHFINSCDEYCQKYNIARSTLSRQILSRGNRLDEIASGETTITLRVLDDAKERLKELKAAAQKREVANG